MTTNVLNFDNKENWDEVNLIIRQLQQSVKQNLN